jgi:hypothetical protein
MSAPSQRGCGEGSNDIDRSLFSAEIVDWLDYNHKQRTRRFGNFGICEMTLLNTLAPFGIGIFTIGAIAVMCGYQKTSVWFSAGALLLVGVASTF